MVYYSNRANGFARWDIRHFSRQRRYVMRPSLSNSSPTIGLTPVLFPLRQAVVACVCIVIFSLVGIVTVFQPLAGIGLLAAAGLVWVALRIVPRPITGLHVILWVFPSFQIVTCLFYTYYPGLPLIGSRFWLELLLGLMAMGVALRHILRRDRTQLLYADLPVLLLVLSGAYGLTITLTNVSYVSAIFGLSYSLTPILCYFVLRWTQPTSRDLSGVFRVFLFTFVILAILSFLEYFTHPAFMLPVYLTVRHAFFKGLDTNGVLTAMTTYYMRMESLLLEEDFWGALCSLVSLLCMARIATGKAGRLVFVAFILALLGLIYSMSRGATIGWFAGMMVLVAVHQGRRLRVLMIIGALTVAATAAYLIVATDARIVQMEQRIVQSATSDKGFDQGRHTQFAQANDTFQRFPSGIGVGASGFAALYTHIGAPIVTDGMYYHIAVEQGVPGLIAWGLALPGMAVVLLLRLRMTTDPLLRSWGSGLLAVLGSFVVHCIAANVLDYYYVPDMFFIFFGLFMAGTDSPHAVRGPTRLLPAKSKARP